MGVLVKVIKEPVEKKILLLDKDVKAGEVIYTVSIWSRSKPPSDNHSSFHAIPNRKNPSLPSSITTCKKPAPTALTVCVQLIPKAWSSRRLTASTPYTVRPIVKRVPSINPRTCCLAVNLFSPLRFFLWRVYPVRRRTGMLPRPLSRTTSGLTESRYHCCSLASPLVKVSPFRPDSL